MENHVWKLLRKYRKKKDKKENKIEEKDWVKHFRNLLEGISTRTTGEKRKKDYILKEEEEITEEELCKSWLK